jgi:sec-independent protein translocase protein TatA
MGNMGVWQLLILAVIVVLLFGTKKLRSLGGDLGSAIKGFKSAVSEDKEKPTEALTDQAEVSSVEKKPVKTEAKDKDQA